MCHRLSAPGILTGLLILCVLISGQGFSGGRESGKKNAGEVLFRLGNDVFVVPVEGMSVVQFLSRSVLFVPQDTVRDGLPWFGSKRDDWIPGMRVRQHLGIDIYSDSLLVVASSSGVVERMGRSESAGRFLKIRHSDSVKTVYVHISEVFVKKGARIRKGDPIGIIRSPEGNAIDTQLHFEVEIAAKKVDPIPLVRKSHRHSKEIQSAILTYEKGKSRLESRRDELVHRLLTSRVEGRMR